MLKIFFYAFENEIQSQIKNHRDNIKPMINF